MLEDEGFAVLQGALSPADAEAIRQAVGDATRDGTCIRPNNVLSPLRWCDEVVGRLLGDESFVAGIAAATAATDLRWTSGYVSTREPRTGPLPLHQDWWCWDHPASHDRAAPQVAVIIYLDDVPAGRAALRVVPGSQRRLPVDVRLDTGGTVVAGEPGTTIVPAGPGDAIVVDYRLLHGTTANATDERREAVILNLVPRWRELPADLRGHLISGLALPRPDEAVPDHGWPARLLPTFTGPRRDLPLRRRPRAGAGRVHGSGPHAPGAFRPPR